MGDSARSMRRRTQILSVAATGLELSEERRAKMLAKLVRREDAAKAALWRSQQPDP